MIKIKAIAFVFCLAVGMISCKQKKQQDTKVQNTGTLNKKVAVCCTGSPPSRFTIKKNQLAVTPDSTSSKSR